MDLFEKIKEGVDFAQDKTTSITGGRVVNIISLLIFKTGGMYKSCEQWE